MHGGGIINQITQLHGDCGKGSDHEYNIHERMVTELSSYEEKEGEDEEAFVEHISDPAINKDCILISSSEMIEGMVTKYPSSGKKDAEDEDLLVDTMGEPATNNEDCMHGEDDSLSAAGKSTNEPATGLEHAPTEMDLQMMMVKPTVFLQKEELYRFPPK
ncbi:hypothetical protein L2E82_35351 [Cichorium intybus]|uniref:Uncharacterized protein n=1 Tax=Cichorium intybus TaxID=13427 RepID=A0ACB9BNQ4_CICIN|nr:hypothetical protein L2E82_35351 [Cichorium intybus]